MVLKRFEKPDRTIAFEKGRFDTVQVGNLTLGLASYEPGWKWSEHVGKRNGQRCCSVEHVGMVLSGTAAVSFPDGKVHEMRAGDTFHITGEHDSWVIGDEPYVSVHVGGAQEYAK